MTFYVIKLFGILSGLNTFEINSQFERYLFRCNVLSVQPVFSHKDLLI